MTEKVIEQPLIQEVESSLRKRKMTYEEFLGWCDEDTWAEWVDGEVEMVSPASMQHQKVKSFLFELISRYAAARDLVD